MTFARRREPARDTPVQAPRGCAESRTSLGRFLGTAYRADSGTSPQARPGRRMCMLRQTKRADGTSEPGIVLNELNRVHAARGRAGTQTPSGSRGA